MKILSKQTLSRFLIRLHIPGVTAGSGRLWGRISSRGQSLGVLSRTSSVASGQTETGCWVLLESEIKRHTWSWDALQHSQGGRRRRVSGGRSCGSPTAQLKSHGGENPTTTMDPRDTAPDSWEQEDDVEATIDGQLESAFTTLNVNAKPFVPNVNAAEFVPAFGLKAHPANVDSAGEYRGTTGLR